MLNGANVTHMDNFGLTPLHFAVLSGDKYSVDVLLENGALGNTLT